MNAFRASIREPSSTAWSYEAGEGKSDSITLGLKYLVDIRLRVSEAWSTKCGKLLSLRI